MPTPPDEMPRSVRAAALLFACYGVMVMVNALVLQSAAGWAESRDFARAVLRLAGCCVIAYGLMQGRRWAWWLAVVLGCVWALMGAAALAVLTRIGAWDRVQSSPVFLAAAVVVLGAAVVLLLQRASRDAFR